MSVKPLFKFESVEDNKYSKHILPPQYLPVNVKPKLCELCNKTKYTKLIRDINKSNVSDEEKEFLKLAATRHLVFTYSKIADYYAHASKEMQELMEQSALVIIDIDDAIANGYVKLSKDVEHILDESGVSTDE
jgi:hypothetical protein